MQQEVADHQQMKVGIWRKVSFLQSHFQGRAAITNVDNSNKYDCGNDSDNEKELRKEMA